MKRMSLTAAALVLSLGGALAQTSTTTTTTVTTEQVGKIKEYVVKEKMPSVTVTEKVDVGATLPSSVTIHTLPSSVGYSGSYAVVNGKTYLVGSDRKVIRVID